MKRLAVCLGVFWREASSSLCAKIRNAPQPWNNRVQFVWDFEQIEGCAPARMYLEDPVEALRYGSSWPEVFPRFGE